jgi:hypothetical protein
VKSVTVKGDLFPLKRVDTTARKLQAQVSSERAAVPERARTKTLKSRAAEDKMQTENHLKNHMPIEEKEHPKLNSVSACSVAAPTTASVASYIANKALRSPTGT